MDRDSALVEAGQFRQKWNKLQLELENAKVRVALSISGSDLESDCLRHLLSGGLFLDQ